MRKKINYKNTTILLIIGFILSTIFLFSSFTIGSYIRNAIIVTLVFGSVGWAIDRFKPKKLIPFLLIIFYIAILWLFIFNDMSQGRCEGCSLTMHKNIFTNECKCFCVGCGIHAPWYWKEDNTCEETNETCSILNVFEG